MGLGETIYGLLYKHARERCLDNTLLALDTIAEKNLDKEMFIHSLSTARLLSNLTISLDRDDEDAMFAATVCQGKPEMKGIEGMSERVERIISLLDLEGSARDDDKRYGISLLQQDRIGTLIALAGRSNAAEQLYNLSASEAMEYVRNSRKYYLPMCLYAKQNYPEFQMTVNILMEKLRCLLDITEIISNRYTVREMSYTDEIFALMEENARLKGMIARLESNK